jgi:hypothetical protein
MMLKLDAKYSVHNNLNEAFFNVTQRRHLLIESRQMSEYRIKTGYTDAK